MGNDPRKEGILMAEMHQEITPEMARQRLRELREKERRGELTVKDAGEITRMLVILGEYEMERGEKAA
jgi:hypothetical protein